MRNKRPIPKKSLIMLLMAISISATAKPDCLSKIPSFFKGERTILSANLVRSDYKLTSVKYSKKSSKKYSASVFVVQGTFEESSGHSGSFDGGLLLDKECSFIEANLHEAVLTRIDIYSTPPSLEAK